MKKQLRLAVGAGLLSISLGLTACGGTTKTGTEENVQKTDTSVQTTEKGNTTGTATHYERYTLGAVAVQVPYIGKNGYARPRFAKVVSMDNAAGNGLESEADRVILADSYFISYDKYVTTLDECADSCTPSIKTNVATLLYANANAAHINFQTTEQKKVTVNGTEFLKVYGTVSDGNKTYHFVGYHGIFKVNPVIYSKETDQEFWIAFYKDDKYAAEMEKYVDDMAATLEYAEQ